MTDKRLQTPDERPRAARRSLLPIVLRPPVVICGLIAAALLAWLWLFAGLPDPATLQAHLASPSVRIEDRNGRLLYEALAQEGGRHAVVDLAQIPLVCRQAAIATEDRRFYSHPGVDLSGILRALWINLRGGETIAGGSTITQQVARNLLLEAGERGQRSLRRKLREAYLAWRLTQRFSKDEILAFYLNQTYYGGMAYGLEAAAQTFFGQPAARLDLAECALLAGLPQAPALYNPFTDPEAARRRQQVVLGLMQGDGYITAGQRALAARQPLALSETPYPIEAPHFVMMARAQVDRLFTPEQIYAQGGLVVRTTLDLDWQRHAEDAIAHHLAGLAKSDDGLGHNVNSAALTAIDPRTGQVLALVGSPDYFDAVHGGAINMALAPRQPGSALKPIVYAAVLDPGVSAQDGRPPWTAAAMLLDVSTAFRTVDDRPYIPSNYDLREHGPVLVRQALASSLNIPAVLTLEYIGLPDFIKLAEKLGIQTFGDPSSYDLSLALGGGEVRLLDLTAAYGAFANSGYRVTPQIILEVHSARGDRLYTPPVPHRERVLDERTAWLISDILSDNDARKLGFGANSLLRLDRPAAVKTGTTSNFHDNWTVGYTPDLVVGVWSGNTDYAPMRKVNGLSGAAPIWHEFLRTILSGHPVQAFQRPAGLEQVEVCALSGQRPTPACPYRRLEWFIRGTQPTQADTLYHEVWIDPATGRMATADTPAGQRKRIVALDLPPQAYAWAYSQGLPLLADLITTPRTAQAAPGLNALDLELSAAAESGPELIAPADGSQFRFSTFLSLEAQRIQLEALLPPGATQATLWVDGESIAQLEAAPYRAWWRLTPGAHRAWVTARLPGGLTVSSPQVNFTVLE